MDQIKSAFQKVKQDMDSMTEEINLLKQISYKNNEKLTQLEEIITNLLPKLTNLTLNQQVNNPAHTPQISTNTIHNPAHDLPFKASNTQNLGISTGNEGVPADRQTDRQTDQQTEKPSFGEALDILSSLDSLKKEVRNKFKKITDQEFLVFSTIYQLSEEDGYVDYKTLSQKLNLTESSIRDYIGRLIKKGIPIEKNRINNKIIQLSISEKLKKIASLPAIFQLRSL